MNVIVAQDGKEAWPRRVHLLMIARCHVPELPPIQTAAVARGGYRSTNIAHKGVLNYHHYIAFWLLYSSGYVVIIQECVIRALLPGLPFATTVISSTPFNSTTPCNFRSGSLTR